MDMSMHIFKYPNFIKFIIFVAYNTKYLKLIFCMVVGYIIIYILDLFQYFIKLVDIFFIFLHGAGSLTFQP